ncbi:MAG: choline dehydrogenase, partial [Proteobacteria bacterium]|nr:choline dehydrogenase [Pseudomonadota bacterium]
AGPDAMFMVQPFLVTPDIKIDKEVGITMLTHQQRPESKGSIHVKSSNPKDYPDVRFNFLSDPIDRACVVAAMRRVRSVMASQPLAWLNPQEMAPLSKANSDDELIDFVTQNAETAYHPVGTCKMGSDPMAVVDDKLKVRGLEGLRVADASIMPTLTSGNTNAPSIMIGEKCARMVLEAAA